MVVDGLKMPGFVGEGQGLFSSARDGMTLVVEVAVEVRRLLGQMKDFLLAGGGHGEIERVILFLASVRISRFAGAARDVLCTAGRLHHDGVILRRRLLPYAIEGHGGDSGVVGGA